MKPSPSVEAGADAVDLNPASSTAPRIIGSRADGVLRAEKPPGPSTLYRAEFWRLGVQLARRMPHGLLSHLTRQAAKAYWLACASRRRVVFQNVLPALHGDQQAAAITTRELFQQFALKLTDLWRYESGLAIYDLFHNLTGWEHFQQAQAHGRGVLILTIHLGNWEFGAPLLTERGVKLQVITGPEPQAELTAVRQSARARWGIETLALGGDPFAAVQVIRRLEANNAVALLMDRPPAPTAVRVKLFGQPIDASISAAELARASGCALLPVYLPRAIRGYTAQILPEIPYERPALRDRQARLDLTQRILAAFEPAIRLYLNQWYHFVPIWPSE
ncbi:MAG TPA: lysophospholipid acyltransferase family protein [Verrucomicrobiae bacterium]|nr:lysophospholipid acyltransferase family protein [Verrucomicrobiae bacterium]